MKKGATVEAQEKIMELREGALELQEENLELKEKIKSLEESIKFKKKVEWQKPHYFVVTEDSQEGPFCQRCYDGNEKLIRLQGGNNDFWSCLECNSKYKGQNHKTQAIGFSR
jgi:hypothetical protein